MTATVTGPKHRRNPTTTPMQVWKSVFKRVALPVLIALAGLAVLLYPVIVTQLNNLEQLEVSRNYSAQEAATAPDVLNQEYEEARNYNSTRATGPILDPFLARISKDNPGYADYLSRLNLFEEMARIVIPSIKVDLPVYHGSGEDSLQRGVGHLYGTHLPVGGPSTHSVLTAHRGLRNATMFDNLPQLKMGDAVYLSVAGKKLKYEVSKIQVVRPEESEGLQPVKDEDLITLVTCTPYGINSHRLLVTAKRVPMDPGEESVFEEAHLVWQWWMFLLIGLALLVIVLLLWWIRSIYKSVKREQEESEGATSDTAVEGSSDSQEQRAIDDDNNWRIADSENSELAEPEPVSDGLTTPGLANTVDHHDPHPEHGGTGRHRRIDDPDQPFDSHRPTESENTKWNGHTDD